MVPSTVNLGQGQPTCRDDEGCAPPPDRSPPKCNNPPRARPRQQIAELPEEVQLLLIPEHHLASGGTLELEDEFGFLSPKLVLDLLGHPIKPSGEFLLVSGREPDTRSFWHFGL